MDQGKKEGEFFNEGINVNIRQFNPGDESRLQDIIKNCLLRTNSKDYPVEVINFLAEYFTADRISTFGTDTTKIVAEDPSGNIVGTASLNGDEILEVFVDPDQQSHGVGRKMIIELETLAQKHNLKELHLKSSLSAVGFYKKLGYTETGVDNSEKFGQTILMIKPISASPELVK